MRIVCKQKKYVNINSALKKITVEENKSFEVIITHIMIAYHACCYTICVGATQVSQSVVLPIIMSPKFVRLNIQTKLHWMYPIQSLSCVS